MSRFIVVAAVAVFLLVAQTATAVAVSRQERTQMLFNDFKRRFNRSYASAEDEQRRLAVFAHNIEVVAVAQSKRNPLASFGVNEFSDLTADEFKTRHNLDQYRRRHGLSLRGEVDRSPRSADAVARDAARPKVVDWREKGAVVPVKNQGQCGSCWAFSVVANIEGQWALAGHNLTSLSEQELVSCDANDDGCDGGDPPQTYKWLIEKQREKEHDRGTLVTEKSYRYVSGDGNSYSCKFKKENDLRAIGAKIVGWEALPHNEQDMANWLAEHGPISICVDATSFQTYTGGIMTDCISQQLDHCVAIVGYNEMHSTPYWTIRNSWGAHWGEAGYLYLQMFKDHCLVAHEPTSAKVQRA